MSARFHLNLSGTEARSRVWADPGRVKPTSARTTSAQGRNREEVDMKTFYESAQRVRRVQGVLTSAKSADESREFERVLAGLQESRSRLGRTVAGTAIVSRRPNIFGACRGYRPC